MLIYSELIIYHFVTYSMLVVVLLLSRLTTRFNRVAELCSSKMDRGFQHAFYISGSNSSDSLFN